MSDFDRNVHCLLGLPFDAVGMDETVHRVREAVAGRIPCFLSTPNLNFLIGCLDDAKFRESVINSNLSVADGMPLVWIARMLGIPIRERVAGSGLFEKLEEGGSRSLSVFFFGGQPGAAEAACRRLNAVSGGLTCVGHECPGFGTVEEMSGEESIARINASGADFLVVSLGARKGQAWIERNRAKIAVPVISHLGAVVNFVAGTVSRAPLWMQQAGLEWLWRIIEEPGLWRRYFSDGLALIRLLVTRVFPYALFLRRNQVSKEDLAAASTRIAATAQRCVIHCRGAWSVRNIDRLRSAFREATAVCRDIELNLEQTTYIDSAFIGLVMLLHKHQVGLGRKLTIREIPEVLRAVFRWNCTEFLCGKSTDVVSGKDEVRA